MEDFTAKRRTSHHRDHGDQRLKIILSFIEHRVVKNFSSMRPMAKNDPFIHKPYTLGVLCVLRGKFLQWTQTCFAASCQQPRPLGRSRYCQGNSIACRSYPSPHWRGRFQIRPQCMTLRLHWFYPLISDVGSKSAKSSKEYGSALSPVYCY